MSDRKILPWIKSIVDNNSRLNSDNFFKFSDMVKDFYNFLKPLIDSQKISKNSFAKDDDKVDSDFKYKRFYLADKINNPYRYFKFNFGVVIIEMCFIKGFFFVRCFNFQFSDDVFSNGWYSILKDTLLDIDSEFKGGYFYYAVRFDSLSFGFPRDWFSCSVEFFQFCVKCFLDRLKDDSIFNYLQFADNV